jgi:hypothetical protein
LTAIGAWTSAGNYAAKNLTDGFVPDFYLIDIDAPEEVVNALVASGLWDLVDGGIRFHDWCEYQPSASEYLKKREEISEKRAKAANKRWSHANDDANAMQNDANGMQTVCPEPEPEPEPFTSKEVNTIGDSAFDEFWSFYPRKIGKGGAKKTWEKITRRVKPEVIIEGARRMASDPNLPETQFIPHPSTWLNEGRWDDEPYAPRGRANLKQIQQREASEKFLASFTEQPAITANPEWA